MVEEENWKWQQHLPELKVTNALDVDIEAQLPTLRHLYAMDMDLEDQRPFSMQSHAKRHDLEAQDPADEHKHDQLLARLSRAIRKVPSFWKI
jgi:hypothetical protein